MIDPSEELQEAIYDALRAEAAVLAIIGSDSPAKIFDYVPGDAALPYITLGKPQVLPDKYDCIDGSVVFFPVSGWTEGPGSVQCKQLGKAIAQALDDALLTLTTQRVVIIDIDQVQYSEDPDGVHQVVVTVRAMVEPPQ